MYESMPGSEMWPFGSFVMIIMVVVTILPFWFIFSKAGHSRWLSLLVMVPVVNVILLYFLAFSDWPSLRNKNE